MTSQSLPSLASNGHTDAKPSAAQERWDLGPWENGYRQIWMPSGTPFQASIVAHVFGGNLRHDRLVSTAPELFEALSDLLEACGGDQNGGGEWAWQERQNARAAIAKVIGPSAQDTSERSIPAREDLP